MERTLGVYVLNSSIAHIFWTSFFLKYCKAQKVDIFLIMKHALNLEYKRLPFQVLINNFLKFTNRSLAPNRFCFRIRMVHIVTNKVKSIHLLSSWVNTCLVTWHKHNQDNNFNNIIPEVTLYIISNKKLIGASIEDDN